MYDEQYIKQLICRFMDELTTVEEERQISRWFKTHPRVGDELEDYRQMFDYFDRGMPLDAAGGCDMYMEKPARRHIKMRRVVVSLAAACVAAVVMMLVWLPADTGCAEQPAPAFSVASVECVDSAVYKGEPNKGVINKDTAKVAPKPVKKRYRKHMYAPAPPAPLLAAAAPDSVVKPNNALPDELMETTTSEEDDLFLRMVVANALYENVLISAAIEEMEEEYIY